MCEIIIFKHLQGKLPAYLSEHITLNNTRHSRSTRYSKYNAICPKYVRESEGGRTFIVSATKLWNNISLKTRKVDSVACFKHKMFNMIFKD